MMNAIVERVEQKTAVAPSPQSESAAIISMIERMASDPSVDLARLEKILDLRERVEARNAKNAYAAALAKMQPELPTIEERGGIKDRSGNVQSTYAKWADVSEAIRPVLAKHGFAISFRTPHEAGTIVVTGVLSHRAGHSEETTIRLPVDGSGSKNAVQAVGSSLSYGKRYAAGLLLNLTSRHEIDDDGAKAAGPETITEDQVGQLVELMDSVSADKAKFLGFFKVDRLSDLPAKSFDQAVKMLQQKGARK